MTENNDLESGLSPVNLFENSNLTVDFSNNCYVKLTSLFTNIVIDRLKYESLVLLEKYSKRKDFLMKETEFTPRHITTVSGNQIINHSSFIPSLYSSDRVLDLLMKIADEEIFLTPDSADRHAIHRMHRRGDVHGGHVDDYAFVLITCLEAPKKNQGGQIEFVPYSLNIKDLGTNKSIVDHLEVGESYFMRSNKAVHRVLPLNDNVNRTVLVFTYADYQTKSLNVSYSSDSLYD